MATNVGDLVVKLGADTTEFERGMARVTGPGSALAGIGRIASTAALAAGAAIATLSSKGIADFQRLDQQMREVFTLLPGITQDSMDDMTAEVLDFSREFGKLPDEVVPALYQALSAGVPQDNVFAFLETANALAVGGVADLQDSVDVLTGAVNAYGDEMLTFDEASDALFTAVRLGVTTIPELATTIGRVTPISADLGISFDTVAALLATLTRTFPSTAESATGLRSMLAELGKAGSTASDAFLEAAGTTFPRFIEGGGTVEEALQLLANKADTTGLRMNDLFGSIEGGSAAAVLAGDEGSEQLREALAAMDESAGATQAAFNTMDDSIQASWNRLKAGFATLSAEVGEQLAPMFQQGVDWVVETGMPALRDGVMAAFDKIKEFTDTLKGVWERFQNDSDGYFANVRRYAEQLRDTVVAAFTLIQTTWDTVLKPAWEAIEPLVRGILDALAPFITSSFETIEGVLNALSALMRGDFKTAWEEMKGAVETITTALQTVLQDLWNAIETFLGERFEAIKQAASDRWNEMTDVVQSNVESLRTWLEETWEGIKAWLGSLWGGVATLAGTEWDGVVGAIKGAFDGLKDWVEGVFDDVAAAIGGVMDDIIGRITSAWDRVTNLFSRADSAEARAAEAAAQVAQAEADMRAAQEADAARRAAEGTTGMPPNSTGGPMDGFRLPHEGGNMPGMALGGIVSTPMRALVGEAGPEAIMPLDRLDRYMQQAMGGGGQTIDFRLYVDGREVARQVAPNIVDMIRLRTGIVGV